MLNSPALRKLSYTAEDKGGERRDINSFYKKKVFTIGTFLSELNRTAGGSEN
jgi:hypothetical protein